MQFFRDFNYLPNNKKIKNKPFIIGSILVIILFSLVIVLDALGDSVNQSGEEIVTNSIITVPPNTEILYDDFISDHRFNSCDQFDPSTFTAFAGIDFYYVDNSSESSCLFINEFNDVNILIRSSLPIIEDPYSYYEAIVSNESIETHQWYQTEYSNFLFGIDYENLYIIAVGFFADGSRYELSSRANANSPIFINENGEMKSVVDAFFPLYSHIISQIESSKFNQNNKITEPQYLETTNTQVTTIKETSTPAFNPNDPLGNE